MRWIKTEATIRDVLAEPKGERAEIIDGELYFTPAREIDEVDHLWWNIVELLPRATELRSMFADLVNGPCLALGPHVLRPEAAAWLEGKHIARRSLTPHLHAHLTAPDVVLELVNDDTDALVRRRKLPAYLQSGVSVVWLLNWDKRTFTILTAGASDWTVHDTRLEQESIALYPFPCSLRLSHFWDSYQQRRAKARFKVQELTRELHQIERSGVGELDQLRMLLASSELDPALRECDDEVTNELIRSSHVVVRARMLLLCRVAFAHTLNQARLEIEAEHQLMQMTRREAKALCERYCDLLERLGPLDQEARALTARAHAFARKDGFFDWYPRTSEDGAIDADAAQVFARYHATGEGEADVFALVRDGRGLHGVAADHWNHSVRAFLTQHATDFPEPPTNVRRLLAELAALVKPRRAHPPEEEGDEGPPSIYVEDREEPMTSGELVEYILADARERPAPSDVALFWRENRRDDDGEKDEVHGD